MQVKIFEAADMTSGLKRVREELGPDALILSTRTRRDGPLGLLGKPMVEITAAIDGPPPGGNAVTMAERNILTGGDRALKDLPAGSPARPPTRAKSDSPAAGKRIDCTVGADDDLLAHLQPLGKNAIGTAQPSPAKSQRESQPQDAPPEVEITPPAPPPEPKPAVADARQQLLAALAEDNAAKVAASNTRKGHKTAKTPAVKPRAAQPPAAAQPAARPPAPKAGTSKKKTASETTAATPPPAAPEKNGPAADKKYGRRRTDKEGAEGHAGIARQNQTPPPSPSKRSVGKSSAAKTAAKPVAKPAAKSADFFTGLAGTIGEQPVEAPPPILSYLKSRGIEAEAAQALARHAGRVLPPMQLNNPQAVRRCLLDAIQNFISVAPPDFTDGGGQRRIALVGPTGVGKTTTIAKLAAWYLARQYGKLALITIDTYRIAAVEQLKVYGEIMRLPVEVVMDPRQLAACLQKHRDASLILIDTSGHSPQNAEMVAELGEFFAACPPIERHLVLSATTRENELLHSLRAFQTLHVERTIFTKIDECSNLGVLLNVQLHNAQPLSFLTNGQRVPEDLLEIDRRSVAELILSQGAARHA